MRIITGCKGLAFSLLFANLAVCDTSLLRTYTPQADGKISIECACQTPTAGMEQCLLGIMDASAGRPRTTWQQTVFGQANKPIDLAAACYRKRDVASAGGSSCCEGTDESSSKKFFAAKILQ
jgi:hypothetical protein